MTTYSGNCHCGLVKYTITLPGSIYEQDITSCNCSLCVRYGSLFVYFPKKEAKYFSGEGDLKNYSASFGSKLARHRFCPQCGSYMGWQSIQPEASAFLPGLEGVNVRMLNDVDIAKLKIKPLNGLTGFGGDYEVGKWHGAEPH